MRPDWLPAHHWLPRAVETALLILLLACLLRLAVQSFHIKGQSMEPTLHDQEYILVFKAAYLMQPPERGDVIVFQYPRVPQQGYIKRIIAIPGDVISVVDQRVTVNGVTLDEPYISHDTDPDPYPALKNYIVGPDQYFVMGDNRHNSSDSRHWGLVPRHYIIGRAEIIYWPFQGDHFGPIPDKHSVFEKAAQS